MLDVLHGTLIDRGTASGSRVHLGKFLLVGISHVLLKDRLNLVELKFSLEVLKIVRVARRVGSAASIGEIETIVENLIARISPILC